MALERAQQQLSRIGIELQHLAGTLQQPAELVWPHRQALGIEGRRAGEHAKTLAQQLQRQACARLLAHGHRAQHGVFVGFGVVDQAHVVEHDRSRRLGVDRGGFADAAERVLQADQETRYHVGAVLAQRPQRLEMQPLHALVAGLVRQAEQLLLVVDQHVLELPRKLVGEQRVQVLERLAHAAWQRGRCQRRGSLRRGEWIERDGHGGSPGAGWSIWACMGVAAKPRDNRKMPDGSNTETPRTASNGRCPVPARRHAGNRTSVMPSGTARPRRW